MLSYLHAFHAGNHADVLKHSVLTLVLDYMTRKDKPFLYVDTHAGAGRYDLRDERATKIREHEGGIGRIWRRPDAAPQALHSYLRLIHELKPSGALHHYPGSPCLAKALLRTQDRARLFEMHPNEYRQLQKLFEGNRHIRVEPADGFQALRALLPPSERRAVVLVDPPYEVKTDYRTVVQAITAAHRKFATGVYLLWYPVVSRRLVSKLERDVTGSGLRNTLLVELSIVPDAPQSGMTGSGMMVINPPWQLAEALQTVLPYLQRELAGPGGGYRLQQLMAD